MFNTATITKTIWASAIILVGGIFIVIGSITYFSFDLPKIKSLNDYQPPIPSKILAADGTILAEIGKEKRVIVRTQDVPKKIIDSFLAAEDDNFYQHKGVDYVGVMRAMWANLKAGKVVQGGSTITQQLAKSLLLSRERSFARKTKDFLLAQKIEEQFSKDDILFLYLNQIYLGGGYYGVKEGFKGYYGKELEETSIAESALIAGLLVAPTKYSPYVNPLFAKRRQHYVLRRLLETGKIDKATYDIALAEKIKFRVKQYNEFKAGHFTDWVRQRVIEFIGEEEFLTGGYIVQTTLDYQLQTVAEEAVLKGVAEIDKRQGYMGPLENILPELIYERVAKSRKTMAENESNYFTLNENGGKEYEISFDQEKFKAHWELIQSSNDTYTKLLTKGNENTDPVLSVIEKVKNIKAIVLNVNDENKLVQVVVAGLVGFIDADGFSWAHKREISEEPLYFAPVQKPSLILKAGDVIEVKLIKKEASIVDYLSANLKKNMPKNLSSSLVKEKFIRFSLDQAPEVQGALFSIDPKTGYILSFVGGNDFTKSQFNRIIQSKRQPGSSFKPFIYTLALEHGYNPSTIIMDSPESLIGAEDGPNWKPKNYDGKYLGPITFRTSLEKSRNVPTIKLANEMGLSEMAKFMKRIGMNTSLGNDLSFALGSFGISLFELVKNYSLFPSLGKRVMPISITAIKNRNGEILLFNENQPIAKSEERPEIAAAVNGDDPTKQTPKQQFTQHLNEDLVIDKRVAYIASNLLKGVIRYGTGAAAKFVGSNIAGKTGTTSNYVDAWFVGYSQNIVVGTWAGFDENQTLGFGETGTRSALPIWAEYMIHAINKFGDVEFKAPVGIINLYIDKETGVQLSPSSPNAFLETFIEGFEPGSTVGGTKANTEAKETEHKSILFEEEDYLNQE